MKQKFHKRFKVLKSSGAAEAFSKRKLCLSLERSGLPKRQCQNIAEKVAAQVNEGSHTSDIYKKTLRLVKETSPLATVHYSLKKSLFELGPEGHHFENFVARYFEEIGHYTETCRVIQGKFVKHEIDVIGHTKENKFFTECKFHNRAGIKNDIKIALYVKARWDDVKQGPEGKNLGGFYIASNTAFSIDALTYAKGTGLELLGVNAPQEDSFLERIKKLKLYPITSLRQLNRTMKAQLLARNILLAKELPYCKSILRGLGMTEHNLDNLMQEIELMTKGSR